VHILVNSSFAQKLLPPQHTPTHRPLSCPAAPPHPPTNPTSCPECNPCSSFASWPLPSPRTLSRGPPPHLLIRNTHILHTLNPARKWIDSKAGGGPDYGPAAGPIKPLSKRDLQDRWAQHTQHCVTCLAAMAAVRRRAQVAKAAATVLFAGLCAALGTFGGEWATPPLACCRGVRSLPEPRPLSVGGARLRSGAGCPAVTRPRVRASAHPAPCKAAPAGGLPRAAWP
jgi:hypothetical protein